MKRIRLGIIGVYLVSCFVTVSLLNIITHAQQVGRNVNMVSGTTLPGGDPYLQRQNEPSGAVSTRNPMHLLVGANDYRTVDLPGVLGAVETGDAWQGVFKSIDGGQSWFSTLLPGFPQDQSPEGLASPIKGYEAASDPVVRAGTHGMLYYAGMAFDRGDSAPSAAFVARYIDLNNKENADPMEYIDTHLIDYRTGYWDSVEPEPEDFRAGFIDKPWLAVDIPRSGAETCSIAVEQKDREGNPHTVTQQFPGGNVYVAYTVIKAIDDELHSTVLFSYSSDCGESWSSPKKLAAAGRIFQGATIAVDPTSGAVYVSWRQFEQFDPVLNINHPNAIFIARSDDGGKKFSKEAQVAAITAFDQPTLPKNALPDFRGFRFNAYPTMTVDGDGRVYIAWSEYGLGAAEDARVVVSTSGDGGQSWSSPVAVDDAVVDDEIEGMTPVRCRQVFPSLSLSSGHLMVAYYDFREDILEEETPLSFIGDFIGSPEVEFHHSVDVRVAQAKPGPNPVFTSYPDDPSAQVSRYLWVTDVDNAGAREQTQHNKPNLPLFDQGTKPFMGDYVDIIASPAFVQDGNGNWVYNLDADKAGIFHAIWADNRDVRLPTNEDWTAYQPPVSDQPAPFPDPSLADYPNGECDVDLTGMRDQNIYTSQITEGLYVGSPSNTKPLSSEVHRAFVAFVRNATRDAKSYRLTVANQPPGGTASFHQFDLVTQLDVTIPAHSSTSRPVFVTLTEETATVHILVQEIETPGGDIIPPILGGLQGLIELNPDVLNPEILNPEILNPEQTSADINTVEIHNPEILNPEILNPEILNPEILNPEILNPEILNPEILNPEILNPEILNPEILNPEILNPEILNPEILNPEILNPEILNNPRLTDITWTVRNDGNTTSSYTAKPFIAQELPEAANFRFQLLIYRIHATPAVNAITCELETEPLRQRQHHELIVDIRNPEILNPEILNPEILNHDPDVATFYAAPGEMVRVTLRMLDPDITDEYDLNTDAVALATISHAVDSDDAANNETQPDVEVMTSTGVSIDILTTSLPNATVGDAYSASLVAAGGIPPLVWNEPTGLLNTPGPCQGLSIDASGTISGMPTTEGTCGPFTIQVSDGAVPQNAQTSTLSISVSGISGKLIPADAAPEDWFGWPVSISEDTIAAGASGDDDAGPFSGSAYVFIWDGSSWTEQAKLVADDAAAGDLFGRSISIDGDTVVVGAWEDDDAGDESGSAYVFVRSGTVWTQEAKLTASDAAAGDFFGNSLSISGDTVVVGAHRKEGVGPETGAAYVFVRSGTTWTEQAKLPFVGAGGDYIGRSVSIDGDIAVVGSPGDDGAAYNAGAAYVFVRSGTVWTLEEKLFASDAALNDALGRRVSISGDTFVVGAQTDEAGLNSGSAYVFVRNGSSWTEQAKLTASDGAPQDIFGGRLSISGDTVAIGAALDDDGGKNSGSAYIFARTGSTWIQEAKLTANDAAPGDTFGFPAVYGDTVAVGADLTDDVGENSGSVYVFQRSGPWNQLTPKLTASDFALGDEFGRYVSIDGSSTVVGAWRDDDAGPNSGSAYVFAWDGANWSEQLKLTASDAAPDDFFGRSVSMSGDTVVVGAPEGDSTGFHTGPGSAYVFVWDGMNWSEQAKLTASDGVAGDLFAWTIAISGDTAIIGAPYGGSENTGPGFAYVFERNGTVWNEQAKLTASDAAARDRFGGTVSIDQDTIIVGAHRDDVYRGSAYVFVRSGTIWSEQAKLTASDGKAYDGFGFVSINNDTAVVGAYSGDGAATDSGSAYVFVRSGALWTEQAKLAAKDGEGGDFFGRCVSIFGDTIAIGAYGDDDAGSFSGSTYVFIRNGTSWLEQAKLTASDGDANDLFGWPVSISGDTLVVGARVDDDAGSSYIFVRTEVVWRQR